MADDKRRDAIESTARDLRAATGGRMTQTQAEARVVEAARKGDAKRTNGGR